MEVKQIPIDYFLERMSCHKPFSFSRFGDGEILCMFNPEYWRNDNGTTKYGYGDWIYTCGEELKQIVRNNRDYFHGYNQGSTLGDVRWNTYPHKGNECLQLLAQNNIPLIYEGDWQGYDIRKITTAIDKYKPVFIGGNHLSNMKHVDGITDMELIEVDDINAYDQRRFIFASIIEKYHEGSRMFCFSASIVGKIIIDDLFSLIGDDCFMLDFGSVFDPYCGKLSRSNMVKSGFEKYQPFTKLKLE